jgi:hypothetical protein
MEGRKERGKEWMLFYFLNIFIFRIVEYILCFLTTLSVSVAFDWRMMNWKGFGSGQSWPNLGTAPAFA